MPSNRPHKQNNQAVHATAATLDKIDDLFKRARDYNAKGQADQAIKALDQVLRLAPQNAHALFSKTEILSDQKRFERLLFDLDRYDPEQLSNPTFSYYIGLAYYKLTRYDRALVFLLRAIELDPSYTTARLMTAEVYTEVGKPADSLQILSGITPECYRTSKETIAGANILRKLGQYDNAKSVLDHLRRDKRTLIDAFQQIVELPRSYWSDDLDAEIGQQLEDPSLSSEQKRRLHFCAGQLADRVSDHDRAFYHFEQANRLSSQVFEPEVVQSCVSAMVKIFEKGFRFPSVDSSTHKLTPIFIVGLPRAGKTLLEAELGRHHTIARGGERSLKLFIASEVLVGVSGKIPARLEATIDRLSATKRRQYEHGYLHGMRSSLLLENPVRFVTNTLPVNFWNAGVIRVIFPHAKIINVRRHPLDLGLECYMKHFKNDYPFADDLQSFGLYYQAYEAICAHWREVLEGGWLDIDYTSLVSDPAGVATSALNFLGVDEVLSSMADAKDEKITDQYVGRWRNYARHLKPLADMLGHSVGDP